MARLWSSGIELNSITAGIEFSYASTSSGAVPAITTSVVRSGTYALDVSGASTGIKTVANQFLSAAAAGNFYVRVYVRFATAPSRETTFVSFQVATGGSQTSGISIDSTRVLRLRLGSVGSALVGSATSAIAANVWHCIEMRQDTTLAGGSHIVEARLNGVIFATTSTATASNAAYVAFGRAGNGGFSESTGAWYMDDIAINDGSGTVQNSWPGEGGIIHLWPNAGGDNNTYATGVGGTAGTANNYTRVNEAPPDDITSYNQASASGQIDDFNIDDPVAIGSSDTINVVQIGARFGNSSTTAGNVTLRAKSSSGGTVSSSSVLSTGTSTTAYSTNALAAPFNYPLTLYTEPGGVSWTKANLTTSQIGYTTTTATGRVSNVWALVEYTPALVLPAPTLTGITSLTGVTSITC